MKKILIASLLVVAFVTSIASISLADPVLPSQNPVENVPNAERTANVPTERGKDITTNTPQNQTSTLKNPLKVNSIGDLVKSVLQVFSYIAVLFGVVMLIVVGFKYILSQGKPEEMKKASNELLYIVIGLAIVIGARVAVDIVINTMSSTGVIDPNVIQSAKDANK
ncbi:MAG: pilin [Candidatus Taylorbacteria bacterium]